MKGNKVMTIFKKSFPIVTTIEEDRIFEKCYEIVDDIIDILIQYECDEMIADETGEVITLDDFRRMKGILSGLPIMTRMYSTKKK